MSYLELKHYLQSSRQITIGPLQRECDPPEDPNWPAPTTFEETQELMQRLPHWARVVCALTAAEMVLPIWEDDEWVNANLSDEQKKTPNRAIEVIWQWLDEKASLDEVHIAADAVGDAYTADTYVAHSSDVFTADAIAATISAVDTSIIAAVDSVTPSSVTACASYAADAASVAAASYATGADAEVDAVYATDADAETARLSRMEFYHAWWKLCRCRLAFILEAR